MLFPSLRALACVTLASAASLAHSPVVALRLAVAEPPIVVEVEAEAPREEVVAHMPTEAEMRRFAAIIRAASRSAGVEGDLVHAIIWAESSYNPGAVSSAGASGLMQLMPETAKSYGVDDVFDPEQNIRAGVRIMKQLLVQFDGDVELALAAYNAGPNAVIRAGNRIPPTRETETYVPRVLEYYRRLQARKANNA